MKKYAITVFGMLKVVEADSQAAARKIAIRDAIDMANISARLATDEEIEHYEAMQNFKKTFNPPV